MLIAIRGEIAEIESGALAIEDNPLVVAPYNGGFARLGPAIP